MCAVELADKPLDLVTAGESLEPDVLAVLGDQGFDAGTHGAAVAEDVPDEGPGDAVVHAVSVLAASVTPPSLGDAP